MIRSAPSIIAVIRFTVIALIFAIVMVAVFLEAAFGFGPNPAPAPGPLVVHPCYEDEAHVIYFNTHACYPVDDLPEELASPLGVH